jgi:hypothetical protein
MTFTEEFDRLPPDDLCKLEEALAVCGLAVSDVENLLCFRIAVKGKNFGGMIPTDFAKALWELQEAYYRMVGKILHGSPDAVLSADEKERHKLHFRSENGAADCSADLWPSMRALMEEGFKGKESWQILLATAFCAAAYSGDERFAALYGKGDIKLVQRSVSKAIK